MVYTPQRRHAVASLATTIQALAVLQQFQTPNILIVASRLLVQAQITVAPYVHPTRSLFILFIMVSSINASAVFLHLLDFWSGFNGGKGIVLDFVGQTTMSRVLFLDFGIFLLQTISLVVSYITNHSTNIPKSSLFPYDDLLLPPTTDSIEVDELEEEDLDIESGMRRRKGKGKGRAEDDNALWLDEEDDTVQTSAASHLLSGKPTSRRREPPLIFSLSLNHLLNLIFRLPAPSGNPPLTSGGTPLVSPSLSPSTGPLTTATSAFPSALLQPPSPRSPRPSNTSQMDEDVSEEETDHSDTRGSRRGAAGLMPDLPRRIPGDYWVGMPTTDR